ncbi:hypothetical protein [Caldivirga sp. UBA161]|uniref:hypothetical protein n=1 Tax=Caldivirga sp. UBA161 TaxID=1915569 RepID=UPI0025BAE90A|nr:hypothetical protein [Caldivirga sp. UBA161]
MVLNNYEYLPCSLVINILSGGRTIYCKNMDEYLDLTLRALKPCLGFIIDSEKLNLLETQINAVMKEAID